MSNFRHNGINRKATLIKLYAWFVTSDTAVGYRLKVNSCMKLGDLISQLQAIKAKRRNIDVLLFDSADGSYDVPHLDVQTEFAELWMEDQDPIDNGLAPGVPCPTGRLWWFHNAD